MKGILKLYRIEQVLIWMVIYEKTTTKKKFKIIFL